jgi:hypothetical protein
VAAVPTASEFADFLAAAGQKLWPMLPLNPTGYGDSPYQCFSTFAGNLLRLAVEVILWVRNQENRPCHWHRLDSFLCFALEAGAMLPRSSVILELCVCDEFCARQPSGLGSKCRISGSIRLLA